MSTNIERLLIIQDRDRKIAQLSREHDDIPVRKQQIELRLTAHRESLKAIQEEIKRLQASTKQVEVEIDAKKQKIAKFREQQFQIKSNVEYKALEHEIANVEKEIRALEDQEIEILEKTEEARGMQGEREADLKKEESHVVQDQDVLKKRMQEIANEVHDLKIDRDALAKDIEPDWLSRYERIFQHAAGLAIVPVENNSCGGCHMNLPPHVVHDSRKEGTLTQCSYCSRILYWPR